MADDYQIPHKARMKNASAIKIDFAEPENTKGSFVSHVPKDYTSPDVIDNRNNVSATNAGKAAVVENPLHKF